MIRQDEPLPIGAPGPQEMFDRFVAWTEQLHAEGTLHGVGRLSSDGGRTVRRRGELLTIDGPYVETKELVLGYFVIEAQTEEQACQIAGRCPGLAFGASMEVRSMASFPEPGAQYVGTDPRTL